MSKSNLKTAGKERSFLKKASMTTLGLGLILSTSLVQARPAPISFYSSPAPDYAVSTYMINFFGPYAINNRSLLINVSEINQHQNAKDQIFVRIIKNPMLVFSFNQGNSFSNDYGVELSNANWEVTNNLSPAFLELKYTGREFPAGSNQFIELSGVYSPPRNANGSFPVKTTIKYNNREETYRNNDATIQVEYRTNY